MVKGSTEPRRGEPRERRALSNVGGPVELAGNKDEGALLGIALTVPEDPELARDHAHGFHSYPARLHPDIARSLIPALCPEGGSVLDPFCGSGTVLVEARLAGRTAYGVDANPLAVRLSELKTAGRSAEHLQLLLTAARNVADVATFRRTKRVGASRRYSEEDVTSFAPHVLLELDGLRVGLEEIRDSGVRSDLELVLSSLLTKLSQRVSDSADRDQPKRIAAGYPTKLFVNKTKELCERLTAYTQLLPQGVAAPMVREGDARVIAHIPSGSIDLILTSPPYAGNYDYLSHHTTRLRWLSIPSQSFAGREIGARRSLERLSPEDARANWLTDLERFMSEMARVLKPTGRAVLILGDSVVGNEPYYNDDLVQEAAQKAGLKVEAQASQRREHFHGPTRYAFDARPRREHAISLSPLPGASSRPTPRPVRDENPTRPQSPAPTNHRDRQPRSFNDNQRRDNDRPRRFDDRPRQFNGNGGPPQRSNDRPRPPFNNDQPRRFDDRPRPPFNGNGGPPQRSNDRPRPPFNNDQPRRFDDRPRQFNGNDGPPQRSNDRPRPPFNNDQPRRFDDRPRPPFNGNGGPPQRSNDRPRPPFNGNGNGGPPQRSDDRPRPPFNNDQPRRFDDRPRPPFNGNGGPPQRSDDRPRPPFNNDQPRRFDDRPRPPFNGNGGPPQRSDDRPRPPFNNDQPRRFDDRPRPVEGDRRPPRSEGGSQPERRAFDGPRRFANESFEPEAPPSEPKNYERRGSGSVVVRRQLKD